MSNMTPCAKCGKPAARRDGLGLCPDCLLAAGLGSVADATEGGPAGRFVPPEISELAPLFPQLEITGLLGCGGMGAVYKARQRNLDRPVALKILPPDIGREPAFTERFAREAKALAILNHPNIVTIHDFGCADGLFFFVMEFVDGVSLRQLLNAGHLAPREALAIVPQICDALQFAHDRGIVHRDIKPENILLDRLGRVKVADFGVAKLVGTSGMGDPPMRDAGKLPAPLATTVASVVMGTPAYMAPEQRERPSEVDHRADIYSLGVVFYQMLTGELPGATLEPPSRKVVLDVRLDEVVLRALEQRPERRYQQVSEVKTMVETVASCGGSARATAVGARASSKLPASAARPLLLASGLTALALGLALAVLTPLVVEYVDDHGLTRSARQHLVFRRQATDEFSRARESVHVKSRAAAEAKRRYQDAPAAERPRLFEEYEKRQAELTLSRSADAAADLRMNAAVASKQQSESALASLIYFAAGLLIAAGAAALVGARRRRSAATTGLGGGAVSGRLPLAAFGLLYAGFAALLLRTAPMLPERVASHFGAGGAANGWMTRPGYLTFLAVFPLVLGLLFSGVSALVRTMPAGYVNLPRKDYWLAPERRAQTCVLLRGYMMALACLMTLFFGGLHVLTLEANRVQPPRLSLDGLLLIMMAFLISLMLWVIALLMRFAETGEGAAPAAARPEPRPAAPSPSKRGLGLIMLAAAVSGVCIAVSRATERKRELLDTATAHSREASAVLRRDRPLLRSGTVEERRQAITRVCDQCAWALPAAPELIRALRDEDTHVRTFAALSLARVGDLGGAAASRALERALNDPERKVRLRAALALGKTDRLATASLPVLIDALTNRAEGVELDAWGREKAEVVKALGEMGPRARPALAALRALPSERDLIVPVQAAVSRIEADENDALKWWRSALSPRDVTRVHLRLWAECIWHMEAAGWRYERAVLSLSPSLNWGRCLFDSPSKEGGFTHVPSSECLQVSREGPERWRVQGTGGLSEIRFAVDASAPVSVDRPSAPGEAIHPDIEAEGELIGHGGGAVVRAKARQHLNGSSAADVKEYVLGSVPLARGAIPDVAMAPKAGAEQASAGAAGPHGIASFTAGTPPYNGMTSRPWIWEVRLAPETCRAGRFRLVERTERFSSESAEEPPKLRILVDANVVKSRAEGEVRFRLYAGEDVAQTNMNCGVNIGFAMTFSGLGAGTGTSSWILVPGERLTETVVHKAGDFTNGRLPLMEWLSEDRVALYRTVVALEADEPEQAGASQAEHAFEVRLVQANGTQESEEIAWEPLPGQTERLHLRKEALLDARDVQSAAAASNAMGRLDVVVTFTPTGAVRFAEATRLHVGQRLAVLLGGRVRMAPVVRMPIQGPTCVITGAFEPQEAERLAALISAGAGAPGSGGREAVAADERYRVTLTNEVSFEVLAVCRNPRGSDVWWRPDGTRFERPPVSLVRLPAQAAEVPPENEFLIWARWRYPKDPMDLLAPSLSCQPAADGPCRTALAHVAQTREHCTLRLVSFKSPPASLDVQAAIARRAWRQKVAAFDWSAARCTPAEVSCGKPFQVGKRLVFAVTHTVDRDAYWLDVEARRKTGASVLGDVIEMGGAAGARAEFSLERTGLQPAFDPADVEVYVFYGRPWVRGAVRGVALAPLAPGRQEAEVAVEAASSAGPRAVVAEWLSRIADGTRSEEMWSLTTRTSDASWSPTLREFDRIKPVRQLWSDKQALVVSGPFCDDGGRTNLLYAMLERRGGRWLVDRFRYDSPDLVAGVIEGFRITSGVKWDVQPAELVGTWRDSCFSQLSLAADGTGIDRRQEPGKKDKASPIRWEVGGSTLRLRWGERETRSEIVWVDEETFTTRSAPGDKDEWQMQWSRVRPAAAVTSETGPPADLINAGAGGGRTGGREGGAADERYRLTLTNGISVEVTGVCRTPRQSGYLWNPDGSWNPGRPQIYWRPEGNQMFKDPPIPPQTEYLINLRWRNRPEPYFNDHLMRQPRLTCLPPAVGASHPVYLFSNTMPSGESTERFLFENGPARFDMQVALALVQWRQEVAVFDGHQTTGTLAEIACGEPRHEGKQLVFDVTHNVDRQRYWLEVVAEQQRAGAAIGVIVEPEGGTGGKAQARFQLGVVAGHHILEGATVERFVFYRRPWVRGVIRDIVLEPDGRTPLAADAAQ